MGRTTPTPKKSVTDAYRPVVAMKGMIPPPARSEEDDDESSSSSSDEEEEEQPQVMDPSPATPPQPSKKAKKEKEKKEKVPLTAPGDDELDSKTVKSLVAPKIKTGTKTATAKRNALIAATRKEGNRPSELVFKRESFRRIICQAFKKNSLKNKCPKSREAARIRIQQVTEEHLQKVFGYLWIVAGHLNNDTALGKHFLLISRLGLTKLEPEEVQKIIDSVATKTEGTTPVTSSS